jgi:hypothetical protein
VLRLTPATAATSRMVGRRARRGSTDAEVMVSNITSSRKRSQGLDTVISRR